MARPIFLLSCALLLLITASASAALVEQTFHVGSLTVERLCRRKTIAAVNGSLPGPVLRVNEGDSVIIHVINDSPYDLTLHWHGVQQLRNGWADGPDYVAQCPIHPGNKYTYRFNITSQEGTLWWHAHISYLRATVYGAIIIRPKKGRSYPFPKPDKEVPIIFGEWWNSNVVDIVNEGQAYGVPPNLSDAFTINGQPGDLYNCSAKSMYKLKVQRGKTYLLRLVNAALQSILFFKVANHSFTVVAVDASYINPYNTDIITIAPGQTMDVLLKADQPIGSYYMRARVYQGSDLIAYSRQNTTAVIEYIGSKSTTPIMPVLPATADNDTAHRFFTNLTALTTAPFWHPVPKQVDERLFITLGLGLLPCDGAGNRTCLGPAGQRIAASMNNRSFEPSTKMSILQAHYYNISGIYTTDFPNEPPVKFDYSNESNTFNFALLPTVRSSSVKQIKYNSSVEIIFQNTAFGSVENHPMHLHGYDVHVIAQGYGNYDPAKVRFNLINPQLLNTVPIPIGGWAVIRFRANNPGAWFMHCHLEVHVPWGLAGALIVENGPTPETSIIPPPLDLPKC